MNIEYEITPDDIIAYSRFCSQNAPDHRRSNTITRIFFLLLAILTVPFLLSTQSVILAVFFLLLILLAIGALLRSLFFSASNAEKLARKYIRSGRYKYHLGRYRLSLEPNAFQMTSPFSDLKRYWFATERIVVTEQHIYIVIDNNCGEIVPRRAFSSETQCEEFIRLATQYQTVAKQNTSVNDLGVIVASSASR